MEKMLILLVFNLVKFLPSIYIYIYIYIYVEFRRIICGISKDFYAKNFQS